MRQLTPAAVWRGLSPGFFLLFWGLQLADLAVPRRRYEAELAKQRAALRALEESTDTAGTAIQVSD